MKERDFLAWTMALAALTGWRCLHVPAPMLATRSGFVGAKQASGLPDLLLLHEDPPRMILAELKGTNGKLTEDQRDVLRLARDAADGCAQVAVYAWTPEHRPQIETILKTKCLL